MKPATATAAPSLTSDAPASRTGVARAFGREWLAIAMLCTVVVTVWEAVLIEQKFLLFSGGFLTETHLAAFAERALFIASAWAADFALIVALVVIGLRAAMRFRLSVTAVRFAGVAAALTPFAIYDVVSYEITARLGGNFDLALMFGLVGGRLSEFLAVSWAYLLRPVGLMLATCAAIALVCSLLTRFFPDSPGTPTMPLPHWGRVAAIVLLGATIATIAWASSDALAGALRRKPAAWVFVTTMNQLSDLDRDGYGIFNRPTDVAPLDASIHPYAADRPANGIDEDGIAGDLPASAPPASAAAEPWRVRPDVVLILLESVRADAVGAHLNGKAVTPVLDGLADVGGSAALAFSHNGFTYQSRYHLLTGRLESQSHGSSLIDDFKRNGYRTGYFSGQDDSFGGSALGVGYERADVFYDARSEPERRYTTFSTPGSLAVPAEVVSEHVLRFVRESAADAPLFVYANFHDTHFPYHHRGIHPLIAADPLPESAIDAGHAAALRNTYLNTLANVDSEIGRILAEVERVRGRAPAVIVTSDHGESLFDEGFLGHGYALNDAQTRVPFVAARLPLVLSEPFGHADIREALQHALRGAGGHTSRPQFVVGADRATFQYLGSLERPRQIGVVTAMGRTVYDFRTNEGRMPGSEWISLRSGAHVTAAVTPIVHRWERLVLQSEEAQSVETR
jgi:hypothetical protein